MTGKIEESTAWYAEYVQLGTRKDRYVFHLGSDGYTVIDGRLNKSNAMRMAANRAKELNSTWFKGIEVLKGFVIMRAGELKGLLDRDDTLTIYTLDLEDTHLRVDEPLASGSEGL